jgi:Glycosyl hydrolase family 7
MLKFFLTSTLVHVSLAAVCLQNKLNFNLYGNTSESWFVAVAGGTTNGEGFNVSGGTLTIQYGYRAYLVESCDDPNNFTPAMYENKINFLGRTFSFTVDLSTVGCGCNAAFYLSELPGRQKNGNYVNSSDLYCDANDVGGAFCVEEDVMEANNAAYAATPHRCDAPTSKGYYASCDKGGCGVNSYKINPNGYGPGPSFLINTMLPFNVSTNYGTDLNGNLVSVATLLSQGSNSLALPHTDKNCGAAYLESMSEAMVSMVPIWSLWSGESGADMSWLDVPPCDVSVACDRSCYATYSNIAIV